MTKSKYKEIEEIKIPSEFKTKALKLIDDTIEVVTNKFGADLSEQEKTTIRNLSLDQINVNVGVRANLKYMWVFDTEETLPVIVEKEHPEDGLFSEKEDEKAYSMKPNLSWTYNKSNVEKEGLSKQEFHEKALRVLLEDFETAAFYGALSYVS